MKRTIFIMILLLLSLTGCLKITEQDEFVASMEQQITLPLEVSSDINLPKVMEFKGKTYDVVWTTSNGNVIDVTGKVRQLSYDSIVRLEATVTTEKYSNTILLEVTVMKKEIVNPFIRDHQFVEYAKNLSDSSFNKVRLVNDRLELIEGETYGWYTSEEIDATPFTRMVGSWGALSSSNATVELQVRVMIDGSWSRYFSYRPWGLGKNNASLNVSDSFARISIDEIIILNSKLASKFQYRVFLDRANPTIDSPKLELVAFALTIPNHEYKPSVVDLPKFVDYDVPMLNQQAVPTIGNSICSPTSAAMLLMYKGHDFSSNDELPHRYTAGLFRDYGANIYGNWVFNTVGMSSFSETSYVGIMYSFEELMHHLVNVGPVAASVSGDMGVYTTGGHLIVVRGYRITDDGDIFVIVNDPNINSRFGNDGEGNPLFVYYEFPLEVFMRTWKGIVYIIN
ncbi:MAG TPA: C39 family peptidase [Bacilli bacterium]|nr:C39 family peptidase [Bacilli bacterium]